MTKDKLKYYPAFHLPRKPDGTIDEEKTAKLVEMFEEADIKWAALRKKYPGKTTREIMDLESKL